MTENFFDTIFPVKHLYSSRLLLSLKEEKELHEESFYCSCSPERSIVKEKGKFVVVCQHDRLGYPVRPPRIEEPKYPPIRIASEKELNRHQTEWIDEEYKSVGIHDTYSRIGSESAIGLRILQGFRMRAGGE